jgi:peroxiredoxin
MQIRIAIATILLCSALTASTRADRLEDFNKLEAEFEAAEQQYFESHPLGNEATPTDKIRRHENWPGLQYFPRFVAFAEANPSDEAAYQCCLFMVKRSSILQETFPADQKAWHIIAAHHARGDNVPKLCLEAVDKFGPAQEEFLRGLLKQTNLSREHAGFATLALAELLAHRAVCIDDLAAEKPTTTDDGMVKYWRAQTSPDWKKELIPANANKFKAESRQLFQLVLDRYADVPCTITAPNFRNIKKLGDKAEKSIHALDHLIVGAEAPEILGKDLNGHSLDLKDYRGRVVLISFWFAGCGPCIALVPDERKLIETFKDRPFALLSVNTDEDLDEAQKTAKEHKIDWPCWFDGGSGPIANDYNVLKWPTLYLLDKNGRIVAKDLDGKHMAQEIAKLLDNKE